jgi:hypothetical protein
MILSEFPRVDSVFRPFEGECSRPSRMSSVKWNKSSGHGLLAVGSMRGLALVLLDPESGRTTCRWSDPRSRWSSVTALEWKGASDLVVAQSIGIRRYDVRSPCSEIASYPAFRGAAVTQLQWHDNILAATGRVEVLFACGIFGTVVTERPFKSSDMKVSAVWSFVQCEETSWQLLVEPTVFSSGTSNQEISEQPFRHRILCLASPCHCIAMNSWPRMGKSWRCAPHVLLKSND